MILFYSSILSPLSHLFLIAVLIPSDKESQELNLALHTKLTIGRTVSSVYNLRDLDGSEGIFFVFPDISVRIEGNYRLQMCLFKIQGHSVNYITSVLTKQFTVYNAKNFPGMHPSCSLIKSFAAQGLKIRIRTESGPRLSRRTNKKSTRKNTIQKKAGQIDNTSNETSDNHNSVISVNSLLLMDDKEGSKSIIKESSEKEVIDNGNIVFSKDNKQKSQISFKSSCYNPVVDMNEAKKKGNHHYLG
ncbi:velvet factor-domain-containing protein [Cokeromyces recurvatus]|uniref:velvet factor-domain-containing protein n=1 Tax=Cokeromyces recurvatus TaxID=90255 RepID=UPI0022210C6C|nr:velvet factor-domain-containing protein [Cokeromyces recurvatus]KAI7904878.1 velvet factor-domain-containing protein [Cokeromyces recurvatus]